MSATRQRLELMNIDLWALREQATESFTPNVWRDQLVSGSNENSVPEASLAVSTTVPASLLQKQSTPQKQILNQAQLLTEQAQSQPLNEVPQAIDVATSLRATSHTATSNEVMSHVAISHEVTSDTFEHRHIFLTAQNENTQQFEWQFCILPQVILLFDATQWRELTTENDLLQSHQSQQILWQNIVNGLHAQMLNLFWPPVIQQWQEQRGQAAYIAGFLAAHAQHKSMIVLGQLPSHLRELIGQSLTNTQDIIEMPSLAEMLLNWRYKQNLWLKIRECNRRALTLD